MNCEHKYYKITKNDYFQQTPHKNNSYANTLCIQLMYIQKLHI